MRDQKEEEHVMNALYKMKKKKKRVNGHEGNARKMCIVTLSAVIAMC